MKTLTETAIAENPFDPRVSLREHVAFGRGYLLGARWATRWIPVEEELPKEGKVVLTKVHCAVADNINYQVATFVKQVNIWITPVHTAFGIPECLETVETYVPTHWRPVEYNE